jgi:hypothetical protein
MKNTPKTPADGAAEERRLWMRKIREMRGQYVLAGPALMALEAYGKTRTKRNKSKEGGL